jgi:hypothetical protein
VNLPKAVNIRYEAFGYTGDTVLKVTLGSTPPSDLDTDLFDGVSAAKSVTVKVPTGASASYDTDWQNGFKGAGYTGSSAGSGTVNTNITLTIEEYMP